MESKFSEKKSKPDRVTFNERAGDQLTSRDLTKKSGFINLQERLASLASLARGHHRRTDESHSRDRGILKNREATDKGVKNGPQFASLHELFSSSQHQRARHNRYDDRRKPKIPIMKLSKNDWNVRCWEERLKPPSKRVNQDSNIMDRQKPERQVDAFQGRIEDVASKLQKIREGAPLDEKLFELTKVDCKIGSMKPTISNAGKSSHEWTDLLKQELKSNAHDQKALRTELNPNRSTCKSPLGRPIRRIFDDSSDDDDDCYYYEKQQEP